MELPVAKLGDFGESSLLAVMAGEESLVLIKTDDGKIFALENRCSHQDVELSDGEVAGCTITCAAHGAKFDVATGKALCMPAVAPVRTFPVSIRGGEVFVTLDSYDR